MAPISMTSSDL